VKTALIRKTLAMMCLLVCGVDGFAQAPGEKTPVVNGPNRTTLDPPKIVAITGGKLLTVTHGTIENGVIVLENGKISAIGTVAATKIPKGAQVFDAKGMTVYPGLFDAETNLGLTEVSADENSNDLVELSDEIQPQMRVVDAFRAETVRIPVNRINGVTNAIVAPASGDSIATQ
jgi:imidazolonepropionase-like amidohydrolase